MGSEVNERTTNLTWRRTAIALCVASVAGAPGLAQIVYRYTQTEATTARVDAQRTGWVPVDHFIAPDRMNEFSLQWKTKIENVAENGASLGSGIVTNGGLGITLAYLGASDNRTIAVDMDNGFTFFNRSYGTSANRSASECPGASLATPTRSTSLTPPPSPDPTVAGQSATGPNAQLPFGSVIGEPGEGIPPVKPGAYFATPGSFFAANGAQPYTGTPASAAAGAAYAATGPAGGRGGFGRGGRGASGRGGFGGGGGGRGGGGGTYAVSDDGVLHSLTTHDGLDAARPIPFLPAGAHASDLTMINGVIYTATQNGCGGAPNGIWSITPPAAEAPDAPKPMSWLTGGTASPRLPSFSEEGVLFVAVGSGTGQYAESVVSLDPASLSVKAAFHRAGADFVTAPVVFRMDALEVVADQAADGRIFLLDGSNLSQLGVSSAVSSSGGYTPAGLATWRDASGQRWLLSATATSVVASKVMLSGHAASITPAWTLGNLRNPLAPLVVNGVVFALSGGEALVPAAQRAARSVPAQLFAVDALTGKPLWNSGKTITTFVPHASALWNSMGQVLVGANDNVLYAFGMNMYRRL